MANYTAEVIWQRGDQNFLDHRYSRKHLVRFDGGVAFAGSSSPHVVPLPMSDPLAADPEEMFVAALSSCHMLWFLHVAVDGGFEAASYEDQAVGEMTKNEQGKLWMTRVTLHPHIEWRGERHPTASEVEHLHRQAHEECFIANSIKTEVTISKP